MVACLPARAGLAFAGKLFADQEAWFGKFVALTPEDNQAVAALPQEQQPAALAQRAGLDTWAAANGLPLARSQVCLADKAAQDKLLAIRKEAMDELQAGRARRRSASTACRWPMSMTGARWNPNCRRR